MQLKLKYDTTTLHKDEAKEKVCIKGSEVNGSMANASQFQYSGI